MVFPDVQEANFTANDVQALKWSTNNKSDGPFFSPQDAVCIFPKNNF